MQQTSCAYMSDWSTSIHHTNYLYNCSLSALYFNLNISTKNTEYCQRYSTLFQEYIDKVIEYCPKKDAQYYYLKGVQLYSKGTIHDISTCFNKAMSLQLSLYTKEQRHRQRTLRGESAKSVLSILSTLLRTTFCE